MILKHCQWRFATVKHHKLSLLSSAMTFSTSGCIQCITSITRKQTILSLDMLHGVLTAKGMGWKRSSTPVGWRLNEIKWKTPRFLVSSPCPLKTGGLLLNFAIFPRNKWRGKQGEKILSEDGNLAIAIRSASTRLRIPVFCSFVPPNLNLQP